MVNSDLKQPLFSKFPEPGHTQVSLEIAEMINLLIDEENYFEGDQNNTKLMITRLRKIFYDKWGWDSEVIRGAKQIEGRYIMAQVQKNRSIDGSSRKALRNLKYEAVPGCYEAQYRATDKLFPERVGQVPFIYKDDHQELILKSGFYCDLGHVLSGLDAFNYEAPISPLPDWLLWFRKLGPSVNSNFDFATWLGDIASAAGDYIFEYMRTKQIDPKAEQEAIDKYCPASDMLGNIDAYSFAVHYKVQANIGERFTSMLKNFYLDDVNPKFRETRVSTYCTYMGLKGWNGKKFCNEEKWLQKQVIQLRNATSFYVYGAANNEWNWFKKRIVPLKVWLRRYDDVVDFHQLMVIYLDALKEAVKKEPIDYNRL